MDQMKALLPGYEIRPLKDFVSLMTSTSLPGLDTFVRSMIALGVAIGFLVIFLSMYSSVVERTRDIGVLKSLGASKAYIMQALLSEIAVDLRRGYSLRRRNELRRPGILPLRFSHPLDPDHGRLDHPRRNHRRLRGLARRALSRMAGQPQRCNRSSCVRLTPPDSEPLNHWATEANSG